MTTIDSDGIDTALARLLHTSGALDLATLRARLSEVRERRLADARVTLAHLLVERGLVAEDVVSAALERLTQDPTLLETLPGLVSTDPSPVVSGERFGPYLSLRELARGGMGAVHEAVHEHTGVHVALKTLLPAFTGGSEPEELKRFRVEAEAMGRMNHPHVATIHAAVLAGPRPYLVQDLLRGGTLQERVKKEGNLEIAEAVEVASLLAAGLQHCHERGVLHRDLKPQNVLFNELGQPVLTDFGLAYAPVGARRLTQTGTVMGTPGYMAPEQATGSGKVDARTDVYGLGAVLYFMLTGRPPFRSTSVVATLDKVVREAPQPPSALRAEIPGSLEAVCLRALAKVPSERQADMTTFADELRGSMERGERRFVRVIPALCAAAMCVALAAWAAWAAASGGGQEDPPRQASPRRAPRQRLPKVDPAAEWQAISAAKDWREQVTRGRAWLGRYPDHALAATVAELTARKESRQPWCVYDHFRGEPGAKGYVAAGFVDAHTLWTLGAKRVVRWSARSGEELQRWEGVLPGRLDGFYFAPVAGGFAVASGALTWIRGPEVRTDPSVSVTCLASSHDGRLLAAGLQTQEIAVFNAESGERVLTLPADSREVCHLMFSPDDTRLWAFSGGRDFRDTSLGETARQFDTKTGELRREWHTRGLVRAAATAPDGSLFLGTNLGGLQAWKEDGTFRWELQRAAGRATAELEPRTPHTGSVRDVVFSADGASLYSLGTGATGAKNEVFAWDWQARALKSTQIQTAGRIYSNMALSPDGEFLLLGTRSGTAELWVAPR